jgi:hypothetical protein
VIAIQQQLNWESSDDEDGVHEAEGEIRLVERRRFAETSLSPSTSDEKGFRRHISFCVDMVALRKRKELQWRPRGQDSWSGHSHSLTEKKVIRVNSPIDAA